MQQATSYAYFAKGRLLNVHLLLQYMMCLSVIRTPLVWLSKTIGTSTIRCLPISLSFFYIPDCSSCIDCCAGCGSRRRIQPQRHSDEYYQLKHWKRSWECVIAAILAAVSSFQSRSSLPWKWLWFRFRSDWPTSLVISLTWRRMEKILLC